MDAIPLIRARYLQAFAAVAERMGVRPERLLEDLEIPEAVTENPDTLHPARQLFAFAARAARRTGRPDLGMIAGRTELRAHGGFGAQVVGSLTLHQALGTFCAGALKEYSRAHFWIEPRGEDVWFCRDRIDGTEDERQQVELYLVELMLQTVRMVAGAGWRPRELWLQSIRERELRDSPTLAHVNVRFGSPILAFPISRRLMIRTIPRRQRDVDRVVIPSNLADSEVPAADFIGSMRQLIRLYLPGGHLGIESVSEVTGASVRTLQRRLAAEGTSYSELVYEVRLEAALPLLEDPTVPVNEIAFGVGYSRPAHFTRAFKRWTGVTPSTYRANLAASG
jgi:AraC-like DNA-binding protein